MPCAELELIADGLHLKILDPYGKAQLLVRYPQSNDYQEVKASIATQQAMFVSLSCCRCCACEIASVLVHINTAGIYSKCWSVLF